MWGAMECSPGRTDVNCELLHIECILILHLDASAIHLRFVWLHVAIGMEPGGRGVGEGNRTKSPTLKRGQREVQGGLGEQGVSEKRALIKSVNGHLQSNSTLNFLSAPESCMSPSMPLPRGFFSVWSRHYRPQLSSTRVSDCTETRDQHLVQHTQHDSRAPAVPESLPEMTEHECF